MSNATTGPFTVRHMQSMLGLSRTVLTGLIRAGFVAPTRGARNEHLFSFQDLMLLRTAYGLQKSKIPPRRILGTLAKLKSKLPDALPLTGLRITAVGNDVAVRDREGRLEGLSGQLLMDFDVAPQGDNVVFVDRSTEAAPALKDAESWFKRAEALESSDPKGAERSYRQALASDAEYLDAYLNLGALLCELQRGVEAVELYDSALIHCPGSALIHFNRAVALEDTGREAGAIASYERSLGLDPTLADAHFNIGRLQEKLGDARGALRHFSAYRRLQH